MRGLLVVSFMAAVIAAGAGNAAPTHQGWFVRVCPAKTDADRIHLTFSGGRQGFSWSWVRARTPDETDLPAGLTPLRGSPCAAARSRRRAMSNHTPMSASGSVTISFSAWNSTITRTIKRIGMIPTIAPARTQDKNFVQRRF